MEAITETPKCYPNTLGLILCGGRGTRMGGRDKGLVPFQQQPMAAYAIRALSPCAQVVINANRHHEDYRETFQLPVISDESNDFSGPLAGLSVGLRYAAQHGFEWVLSSPCDAPYITTDYVHAMHRAAAVSQQRILMASDTFRQPVFAMLHVSVADALSDFLQGERKKILIFYQQIGYETVKFTDSTLFTNINTPDDL